MFFGTPHRGSGYANLGLMAKKIAVSVGFDANSALLRDLQPNAQFATVLREEFSKMLLDNAFYVDTFQESMGYKGIKGLSGKV